MPDTSAIRVRNAGKTYRLYSSLAEQALDVLGFSWMRFWRRPQYREFQALHGVSLDIDRGERVGILGRNGAGKTTLLKLITGNFAPSSGEIRLNGNVQALMGVGLGFHPEFSGRENIRSSLIYNGLAADELEAAAEEVARFVELGDFLDQPVKTYSQGMQARLMFATSTAIRPDILIVDEILGAGDAYFSAKSAHRMEQLTASGCTLLLVSHSMQQVLQFCRRAVWLENGKVVMDGDAVAVVKAYEEYTQQLEWESAHRTQAHKSVLDDPALRGSILAKVLKHADGADPEGAAGGVSRWRGVAGLKIAGIRVTDEQERPLAVARTGQRIHISFVVEAEHAGVFPCLFVVVLFTEDGRALSRHCSALETWPLEAGQKKTYTLRYDNLLLGQGRYFFSAAVYRELDLARLSEAKFYDLLSRSFEFRVVDAWPDDPSLFHHPGSWVADAQ
jgi:lipopolysaccharide transport system ATP-binding protein